MKVLRRALCLLLAVSLLALPLLPVRAAEEEPGIESVLDDRPYVRVKLRNAREGSVIAAYFSDFGKLLILRVAPIKEGQTEAELDFGQVMHKSVNLRVYLLDKDGKPQTKNW